MKIIYGTTNLNKIKEMQELLKPYNFELLSLKDIDFSEEIEENGTTFLENSLIKAKAILNFCQENKLNYPILTDDAGLCVKSLDNRPGVYTARYAGDHAKQEVVIDKLLTELKEKDDRSATFFCALTFIYQDKIIQVEGYKEGTIATKIGKLGGFTFGPIFIPNGYQKPYNELTNFETHRHDAVNKLIKKIEELKII